MLKSPPYLAVGGENSSPWTKRTARLPQEPDALRGRATFPGERTAPSEAAALLVIATNIAPEHESDFNEWYNKEHVPALARCPDLVRPPLPRHRRHPRYVALYHFVSPEVPSSDRMA